MRAIVAGAGIAGLVTARQLGLAGWNVEVLEKTPAPRSEGYMMDFFGPGVEASERIGLYPRLAAVAYHVESADYVNTRGHRTCSIDYAQFSRLAGGKVLSLLRPDIERVTLAALEGNPGGRVRVRYGARVTAAWTDDGGACVCVGGAPRELLTADLLVGADGIHSQVRAGVFGPEQQYLYPLGMRAAAFMAEDPALNTRFRNRFILTDTIDRVAGIYGLRGNEVAAFLVYRDHAGGAALRDGQTPGARERLRREFAGLGGAVDRLLELCPEAPYDDVVTQIVMPDWHQGCTVLVGDACGAVSLLAGQGGSLAIAGAALLGDLLGPVTTPGGISRALDQFEQRWRPVVQVGQESGRRAARSFLPRNAAQCLLRRWIIRATRLPGIDRMVARQILGRIAK